jgi:hypothetical protein
MLNHKVEALDLAKNLFFVFVCLNDLDAPEYYVVPRKKVITYARDHHVEWLSKPRRDGRPHRDSSMRKFRDRDGLFLDRWDILGLDAAI